MAPILEFKLIRLIQKTLAQDESNYLRLPKYQKSENSLAGHCYIASETFYHLAGGKNAGYKAMIVKHKGENHWYISGPNGIIDITAGQFSSPVPYKLGKGTGFLTKLPSKRSQILINSIIFWTSDKELKCFGSK